MEFAFRALTAHGICLRYRLMPTRTLRQNEHAEAAMGDDLIVVAMDVLRTVYVSPQGLRRLTPINNRRLRR
jgi:hypothetical protein